MRSNDIHQQDTTTPLLVLDVDGVVNGFFLHPDAPGRVRGGSFAVGGGLSVAIRWRQDVVERISTWVEAGLAAPVWCTTWRHHAIPMGRSIGLARQPWPVLEADGGNVVWREDWWKLAAVTKAMTATPARRAVWVDDDLGPEMRAVAAARFGPRITLVTPDSGVGLSDEDLDAIERVLQGQGTR